MNKTHSFVDVFALEKILTSFSIFFINKNVYFVFHLFFYWVIFFFLICRNYMLSAILLYVLRNLFLLSLACFFTVLLMSFNE